MFFIKNWWYKRQRKIDLDILWPCCQDISPDIQRARAAFASHAFSDPAWLALGEDAIIDIVDNLN